MSKKILVIVDMQNDFIDGALANQAAKSIVPGIVELIKSGDFSDIICTVDTHDADYLDTVEGKNLPIPHCIRMTNGWVQPDEIRKALFAKPVQFVEKNTFGSLELPWRIDEDCEEIAFVGTCTGICVINNVAIIKAAYPNKKITVYENLCACVTPDSHQRAIEQMKFNHINIEKWGE